jgi:hypothetical protein
MQTVKRNADGTFSTVDGTAADIPASNVANGSGVEGNVAGGLNGFDSAGTGANSFGELDAAFGGLGGFGDSGNADALGGGSLASPFSELDAATQNLNEPTFAPPSPF